MCNINLILNKKNKATYELAECMNTMSLYSFVNNDDGEGYIGIRDNPTQASYAKSKKKLKYTGMYKFLATHQRLSTSGHTFENIHPHKADGFLLMHNGVMWGLEDTKRDFSKSDTRVYTEMLEAEYKKDKNMVRAIKDTVEKVSGSYSILIMEEETGQLYYFKEDSTKMYIIENEDWLIMSTSFDNIKYAQFHFNIDEKVFQIKPNKIVAIGSYGTKIIGKFDAKKVYKYYGNYYNEHEFYGWKETKQTYLTNQKQDSEVEKLKDVFENANEILEVC